MHSLHVYNDEEPADFTSSELAFITAGHLQVKW